MPAGGIAAEQMIGNGDEGIVLLDGFINGVDTSLFESQVIKYYVGVGGGYTNVEPTGSANLSSVLRKCRKSTPF